MMMTLTRAVLMHTQVPSHEQAHKPDLEVAFIFIGIFSYSTRE